MIILKHGNKYKEIFCKKCGALLGFNERDIQTSESQNPFGDGWSTHTYIICPECKSRITLKLIINGEVTKEASYE